MSGQQSDGRDSDDPVQLLARFVLRARRVMDSRFAIAEDVLPTRQQDDKPNGPHLTFGLLDEETIDAAAARVRPMLLKKKGEIYWEDVLGALTQELHARQIDAGTTLDELRALWERVRKPPPAPDPTGFSDRELADRFLYGDLVHADELPANIPSFRIRLFSAQGYLRDAVIATGATLQVIRAACERGILELPTRAWEEAVTAGGQRMVYLPMTMVAHAPVGTSLPRNFDDLSEEWQVAELDQFDGA